MSFFNRNIKNVSFYLLILLTISFPLFPKLVNMSVFLLSFLSLIQWAQKNNPRNNTELNKNNISLYLPFLFFYATLIFGLLYTQTTRAILPALEVKLSFLLIPFIFLRLKCSQKQVHSLLSYFVYALASSVLFYTGYATFQYVTEANQVALRTEPLGILYFNSSYYSWILHPSYLSMYYCFGVILLLDKIYQKQHVFLNCISLLVLVCGIYFCNSLLGNFALLVVMALFIYKVCSEYVKKIIQWTFLAFILSVMVLTVFNFNTLKNFYHQYYQSIPKHTKESIPARVLVWHESIKLIRDSPFLGYGTGDVHTTLQQLYEKDALKGVYEGHLNPHNQFLQTWLATGILGLFSLLYLFYYLYRFSYKAKDWVFSMFIILFLLNNMVESMLERQAGVIFFVFFSCLHIYTHSIDDKELYKHKIG